MLVEGFLDGRSLGWTAFVLGSKLRMPKPRVKPGEKV
jgi:hypothetical protein